MASSFTLSRSLSLLRPRPPPSSFSHFRSFSSSSRNSLKYSRKSLACPLWFSSFSFCLDYTRHRTTSLSLSSTSPFSSRTSSPMASASPISASDYSNPLLIDFDFPPFDAVKPEHVRPGIRALLTQLENELDDLEKNVEPKWEKLVDPLEKIVDKLTVAWGMVNHLKSVKDCAELRSAIEEVQPEKVKFELRLGQSKRLYNAFKTIQESSDWSNLSEARKRIVENQLKEAILSGVALEGEKQDHFNKIQQSNGGIESAAVVELLRTGDALV